MCPISMPRRMVSLPVSQAGHGSPARTPAASTVPSGVKSRPATTDVACWPGSFAPVSQAPDRDALRADVPLDQVGPCGEVVEQGGGGRGERGVETLQVDVPVTG